MAPLMKIWFLVLIFGSGPSADLNVEGVYTSEGKCMTEMHSWMPSDNMTIMCSPQDVARPPVPEWVKRKQ